MLNIKGVLLNLPENPFFILGFPLPWDIKKINSNAIHITGTVL